MACSSLCAQVLRMHSFYFMSHRTLVLGIQPPLSGVTSEINRKTHTEEVKPGPIVAAEAQTRVITNLPSCKRTPAPQWATPANAMRSIWELSLPSLAKWQIWGWGEDCCVKSLKFRVNCYIGIGN